MKILFYSNTGKVSGAENIMLMILRRLNRSHYLPIAICAENDTFMDKMKELGVSCSAVSSLEVCFAWRPDLFFMYWISFYKIIKRLRAQIQEEAPDLIHADDTKSGLVATVASVWTNIPVIWMLQDALPRYPLSSMIRIFVLLSHRIRLLSISSATVNAFRGWLLKYFDKNILTKIIYAAVEVEKFDFDPKNRLKIRKELSLNQNDFVLGIIGQVSPRKGQLGLIEAFAEVHSEMPSSTLLIVWESASNQCCNYFKRIKKKVSKLGLKGHVKFLEMRKDVLEVMQALDLLVINSKSEIPILVTIEAMAAGTPVLTTDVGGTSEIIKHLKNGWLVNFGDKKGLKQALLSLGRDPGMRQKFINKSKEVVVKKLTAERYMRQLEEFYEQCSNAKTKR